MNYQRNRERNAFIYFVASVVDEPLWPVELVDSQLAHHPIYQVPIIVIAGTLFMVAAWCSG